MDNKTISALLSEIGDILDIKGENPFKIRAYHTAARNIEALTVPVQKLIEEGKLGEVRGIGKALEEKITEYVTTGKMTYYEDLQKSLPEGLLDILRIPSVGPKKVKVLYDKLDVTNIQELEYACNENRLVELDGFGEKTQQKILEGIKFISRHKGQYLLSDAIPVAEMLISALKKYKTIKRVSLAGSIRRRKEVVKDIDIVASSDKPEDVMGFFIKLPLVVDTIAKGTTKSSIRLETGIAADLRVVKDSEFPYALHHFTGSKEHHIAMRGRANKMGLKINEYGIFREKDNKLIKAKDEEEFFKVLGLNYIPPEMRENTGEVEFAEKSPLPELIEEKDIKGTFHNHTNWSDGSATIEEMAEAARKMGLKYLGLSEHTKSASYAGGLDEMRLRKWMAEVDKINKCYKDFCILKGAEVDILKNGSLDYSDKVLSELDYVICSIHSSFNMPEEEMTSRVIKALTNPYVDIFAHPTGRLLLGREGYKINFEKVFSAAKRSNKIIELNAHPQRLDLDWLHLKQAKEMGVKIAINPDAHNPNGLADVFKYGVPTARRGWLTKEDVINTLSLEKVLDIFEKNVA